MLLEYDLQVAEAKAKIDSLVYQISLKTTKTLKNFKKLVVTLQKSEEKTERGNCVWLCEMRYTTLTSSLADSQKDLGKCVKEVWEEIIRLENLRVSSVKKAMQEYMKLQSTLFNYDISQVLVSLDNIEENNSETLRNNKLFKPEEFLIMQEIGIEDSYIDRLASWTPEDITKFDWVLKEGVIYMENGVFQQWQECYAVIVKSRFLHIFLSKPQIPFIEPLESLYLGEAKLMVSQGSDSYVEITENARTGFLRKLVTRKQVVIKDKDSEKLTEWMELIQLLK
jgi:hypothetical protein